MENTDEKIKRVNQNLGKYIKIFENEITTISMEMKYSIKSKELWHIVSGLEEVKKKFDEYCDMYGIDINQE